MSAALEDARAHLDKAREFLQAAEFGNDLEQYNAAASCAVISSINSKDAICLRLVGKTAKSEDHQQAVPELKAAGPVGEGLASTFSRLLRLKTKAQYQAAAISAADAARAVEWAQRMLEGAEQVVSGR